MTEAASIVVNEVRLAEGLDLSPRALTGCGRLPHPHRGPEGSASDPLPLGRMTPQRFRGIPAARPGDGIRVNLPFEPSVVWDDRDAFHVNGTIGGNRFRAELKRGSPWTVELGPSWCRHPGFGPGDEVDVELALEGPQSRTMGADAAAAFQAEPEAARFFDSMPTFYRNNAARAIAAAKRPETRAKRIAEAVARAKRREREG